MPSPGTRLVKNHDSQSRTISPRMLFKEKMSPKLKMLMGLYVTRQLIWRQTPKLCI